jgi:hypothetical protein
MEFEFITDSAPQEILLKFLDTISNTNMHGEKGQVLSRQIRRVFFAWTIALGKIVAMDNLKNLHVIVVD